MAIQKLTQSLHFQWITTTMTMLLLGLPTVASAEDMPKAFDFKVTFTLAITGYESLKLGEKDRVDTAQYIMVATNDAEELFMHHMVGHCHGMETHIGGYKNAGACTYKDNDGNQLYETYEGTEPGKGKIAFIGGTGSFMGIQCEGEFYITGFVGEGGVGKKVGSCKRQ